MRRVFKHGIASFKWVTARADVLPSFSRGRIGYEARTPGAVMVEIREVTGFAAAGISDKSAAGALAPKQNSPTTRVSTGFGELA